MANRYFLNDGGTVCYYGDAIWTKVGTSTSNLPDATSPEAASLSGETFSYADGQGKTVYTNEEMGVANYVIGQYDVYLTNLDWTTLIASCPYAGVVRAWGGDYNQVRINGGASSSDSNAYKGRSQGRPINVSAGDLVEVRITRGGPYSMAGILIPFSYTNPG